MRAVHIALFLLGGSAMVGLGLGGCSASSAEVPEAEQEGTQPTTGGEQPEAGQGSPAPDYGRGTDAGPSSGGNTTKDAGRDATANADAARDSGIVRRDSGPDVIDSGFVQDAAPEGSPCGNEGETQTQACGFCGYQTRVCMGDGDGGTPTWQVWGFCQQATDACEPGTTKTEDCGLCGTRTRTCRSTCTWDVTTTCNQPPNACRPGTKQFSVGLSCTQGPTSGRERVCETTCQWGPYGACLGGPNLQSLTISGTAGQVVSQTFNMSVDSQIPRLNTLDDCPATLATEQTAYSYVALKNTTNKVAKVSVWHSTPTGGASYDTVMAAYNRAVPPSTTAERQACTGSINDTCNSAPCEANQYKWAGLANADAVTVPANGTIIIYSGAYYQSDGGDFVLNAKTDSLQ